MEKIQFKRPELEDKEIISSYFASAPSRSCERTFANSYLWSRHYHVKYAVIEDSLVFQDDDPSPAFAYPAGKPAAVKRALDFLIENSGSRRNLEVDFFGGEPLMNFDMLKELVAYARSIEKEHNKNFRFTLTTNGVLIDDDVIEFANKEISNVVLSLDGRKEVHDRYRVDYAENGS